MATQKKTPTGGEFYAPGLDTVTKSETGAPMKVILPNGTVLKRTDGVEVEIVLYGPDSRRFRELLRERRRVALQRVADGLGTAESDEADESAQAEFLAGMVARWNVQHTDGSNAPSDAATVKRFFQAFPMARDQAESYIGQRANFM